MLESIILRAGWANIKKVLQSSSTGYYKVVHGKTGKINILQINERSVYKGLDKKNRFGKKENFSTPTSFPLPPPTPIKNIMVRL